MPRDAEPASFDWLPDLLRAMAADLGLAPMLRFAAEFGGRELYIPVKAKPDHNVAHAVGVETLRWLVERRPGEKLIVPLGPHSSYRARIVAARRMIDAGKSTSEIVAALRMHERSVRRHRNSIRDRHGEPDLFSRD